MTKKTKKCKKEDLNKKLTLAFSIASIIISIVAGVVIPLITSAQNAKLTKDMQAMQNTFEQTQKEQAAIPILRIAEYNSTQKQMKIYEPYRELKSIQNSDGSIIPESYFSIRNFSFENMANNIAYVNHIEYGGEAFELNNKELTATQGEAIAFNFDNRFIGAGYEFEFYIIVKSIFQKYYSYKCNIYPDGKDGEIYCYSVKSIGLPVEYNIDNEIYKNRHIHGDIYLYPDHIII